jgi:chorismate synthase
LGVIIAAQSTINVAEVPQGDTCGGVVTCVIKGVEPGIGEPVFGKLSSQLAEAMMSIPAAKGFEIGLGFDFANHLGSEVLDKWEVKDDKITTSTNYSGGIQGGISNGNDICFNVVFKPVATMMQAIEGISGDGSKVTIEPRGRHDQCVVPRAVPVVEAMAAIVVLDNVLINRAARL